jgi:hypothetical protein
MRRMLLTLLLGVFMASAMVSNSFAEFVYVTKSGKKYHNAESKFIKDKEGVEKITLEEAQTRGLQPSREYLKNQAEAQVQTQETKKSK